MEGIEGIKVTKTIKGFKEVCCSGLLYIGCFDCFIYTQKC